MHLPDGFIHDSTFFATTAASIAAVGISVYKVSKILFKYVKKMQLAGMHHQISSFSLSSSGKAYVKKMMICAVLLFIMQAFHIPIGNGVSEHFLGGVFAAIVLGPWAALLVMALVIFVQAVFFGDGGVLVLGTNVFHMGVIGAICGGYLFQYLYKRKRGNFYMKAFVAAFFSIAFASLLVAVEIGQLQGVLFHTLGWYLLIIGVGEGVITLMLLALLQRQNISFFFKK